MKHSITFEITFVTVKIYSLTNEKKEEKEEEKKRKKKKFCNLYKIRGTKLKR